RASRQRRRIKRGERLIAQLRIAAKVAVRAESVLDVPDDVVAVLRDARVSAIREPGQCRQPSRIARNRTRLAQKDVVFENGHVCRIWRITCVTTTADEQRIAVAGNGVLVQGNDLVRTVE